MFGVSYQNLGKLAKKAGIDHELAQQLWTSGNHDACVLASKVADPGQATDDELESWLLDLDCYVLTDAFAAFVAASPLAARKRNKWRNSKQEWASAAGWLLIAIAARDASADDDFAGLIEEIESGIHRVKNRTRYAMNSALIAIGARPAFTEEAIAASKRIGEVDVDHGVTGCKTPDATAYIRKIIERRNTR
jgi:3-methyladenine DNA glycosylase AlkD